MHVPLAIDCRRTFSRVYRMVEEKARLSSTIASDWSNRFFIRASVKTKKSTTERGRRLKVQPGYINYSRGFSHSLLVGQILAFCNFIFVFHGTVCDWSKPLILKHLHFRLFFNQSHQNQVMLQMKNLCEETRSIIDDISR